MNLGAYPLFMIHSEGTENDKPYAHFLIQIAELLGVSCDRVLMDAGYDSLELHTLIFGNCTTTTPFSLLNPLWGWF